MYHTWNSLRFGLADPGSEAKEFLTAQITMDRATAPATPSAQFEREFAARYSARVADLMRQLDAEAGVAGLTFSSSVPGGEPTVWIEADGVVSPQQGSADSGWVASGTRAGHQVRFNRVAPDFFETFSIPMMAGRPFTAADAESENPQRADPTAGEGTVILNQSFVSGVLGGSSALGRRVRYVGISNDAESGEVTLGRWYQIVGVVGDFPRAATSGGLVTAKMYHAVPASGVYGASFALRLRGIAPEGFAGRLREISAAVDPNLQLRNIATLDRVLRQDQAMLRLIASVLTALTVSVLLLSAAGIYALVSFTVAQRRKEIGIRAALGAEPRQIFRSICSRALWQMTAGATVGLLVALLLETATAGGLMSGHGMVVLPAVTAVVLTVGMLAVLGPARRGWRVRRQKRCASSNRRHGDKSVRCRRKGFSGQTFQPSSSFFGHISRAMSLH